jgi:transcriptional regulator with XRE-family HTH domain
MALADLLRTSREKTGITIEQLAQRLQLDPALVTALECPEQPNEAAEEILAAALEMTGAEFRGEAPPPEPEPARRVETAMAAAKYPAARRFLLDPVRCADPARAASLFGEQAFSLAEQNIFLYVSTAALYHFCDTNTSSFAFDHYLFGLHARLLRRFERTLEQRQLSAQEKEERLAVARGNVFACEPIENIAVFVLEPFVRELEEKCAAGQSGFEAELDLPFIWDIDEEVKKVNIRETHGALRHQIKLLDVMPRER